MDSGEIKNNFEMLQSITNMLCSEDLNDVELALSIIKEHNVTAFENPVLYSLDKDVSYADVIDLIQKIKNSKQWRILKSYEYYFEDEEYFFLHTSEGVFERSKF